MELTNYNVNNITYDIKLHWYNYKELDYLDIV